MDLQLDKRVLVIVAVVLVVLAYFLLQKPALVVETPSGNETGQPTNQSAGQPTNPPAGQQTNQAPNADTVAYTAAVNSLNLSACDGISNAEVRDACKSVVQSGIDFRNSLSQ
jgi:hypothetical protein